ncbi:hypothetical protein ZEAMMB73_Zm00001d003231 [Zea mays]|uniref:Uncharacterized protein n=1 Tax=Zea mays TaxID=4577 RepID=A0A1D6E7U3_MAIZE|nr:hypothetical protein ZEAMMB73_Zm00001d003231 [Zea mays]
MTSHLTWRQESVRIYSSASMLAWHRVKRLLSRFRVRVITRQSQGHHIVNHKKRDAAKVNMKKAKKKKRMITVPSSMAIRLFRLLLSIDRSSLALALALAFIARYPTSFFRLCCDRLKLARRHGYL